MIRLPSIPLPPKTASALVQLQRRVNVAGPYSIQVDSAQREFHTRNKAHDPVFRVVRRVLRKMCSGAARCGYCEDSAADEVEHFRPKTLYPELAFAWTNYLYACGPCNGTAKNNQFAVLPPRGRIPVVVTRPRGAKVKRPRAGLSALIDPRQENMLDFLEIDLQTGVVNPRLGLSARDRARAEYTLDTLRLNRDPLPQARLEQLDAYLARLVRYTTLAKSKRATWISKLQHAQHPAVWREMQRQHMMYGELARLFGSTPSALGW